MSSRNSIPPPITTASSEVPANPRQASTSEGSVPSSPEQTLSPASRKFFSAISAKVRARSHSPIGRSNNFKRSRSPASSHLSSPSGSKVSKVRVRSRSPIPVTSPSSFSATATPGIPKANTTTAIPDQKSLPMSVPAPFNMKRASTDGIASVGMRRLNSTGSSGSERTEWERMTYGRHSGDWLFGGHSITGSFMGLFRRNDQQN